ncbi:hypothetical protein ABW19_dt0206994 [Dactylella cylindrospora]|nr:hypothetical protein ABW19_dt0206994 [Dactylella cylindrospora]
MEVVGFIASIATLLELSTEVARYAASIRHAKSDLLEIENSILSLQDVLSALDSRRKHYERTNNAARLRALSTLFDNCNSGRMSPMDQCKASLEHIHMKLAYTKGIKKLIGPFMDNETKGHLDRLERLKGLVILANTCDQSVMLIEIEKYSRKTVEELDYLRKAAVETTRRLQIVEEQQIELRKSVKVAMAEMCSLIRPQAQFYRERKLRDVFAWISPIDHRHEYECFRGTRARGTHSSFFSGSSFRRWMDGDTRGTIIHGDVGEGKTVLAAGVVNHLQRYIRDRNYAVTSYFCDEKDPESFNTDRILASIAKQIFKALRPKQLHGYLEEIYDSYYDPLTAKARQWESAAEILEFIKILLESSLVRVFMIVDGNSLLGPYHVKSTPSDRVANFNLQAALMALQKVHFICFTRRSRLNYHQTEPSLLKPQHQNLIQILRMDEASNTKRDMELYIASRISKHRRLRNGTKRTQARVSESIVKTSGNLMQLAVLQLDLLFESSDAVEMYIKSPPQCLNDFYRITTTTIPEEYMVYVRSILLWGCLFSLFWASQFSRNMLLEDVYLLASVHLSTIQEFGSGRIREKLDKAFQLCKYFLSKYVPIDSDRGERVWTHHPPVVEFLLSSKVPGLEFSGRPFYDEIVETIFRILIPQQVSTQATMAGGSPTIADDGRLQTLAGLARDTVFSFYYSTHSVLPVMPRFDEDVLQEYRETKNVKHATCEAVQTSLIQSRSEESISIPINSADMQLHLPVSLMLEEYLLKAESCSNLSTTTPLQEVIYHEDAPLANQPLDLETFETNFDEELGGSGRTGLHEATAAGNAEIAKLLLDLGANPEAPQGGTSQKDVTKPPKNRSYLALTIQRQWGQGYSRLYVLVRIAFSLGLLLEGLQVEPP